MICEQTSTLKREEREGEDEGKEGEETEEEEEEEEAAIGEGEKERKPTTEFIMEMSNNSEGNCISGEEMN